MAKSSTSKGLGKGLSSIIAQAPPSKAPAAATEQTIIHVKGDMVVELPLADIEVNPDQPRLHFDEEEIEQLSQSIHSVGLIQPIIVRKKAGKFSIIAGERRFRACKLLEQEKIKAIVMEATEEENVTLALIENIQRQDLDPIEEAKAYKLLISRFKLKQADVAARVGKERTTVANALRLLTLPESIQTAVSAGEISQGHAKILAGLTPEKCEHFFKETVNQGLSVRALENLIKAEEGTEEADKEEKAKASKDPHIQQMEDKIKKIFGTKVEIKHSNTGKGRIEISYYSLDDFERILEKFE